MLWNLAWQFARRQWKRNLLVGGAVAASVFIMVFLSGMMVGIRDDFQQKLVREGGHLRLHAAGWARQTEPLALEPALGDPNSILARLTATAGVTQAEEFLPFGSMLFHGDTSLFLEIDGVDPAGFSIQSARKGLRSGSFALSPRGLALSTGTARLLGARQGDPVTLLVQDASDLPFYREFTVEALFETGNSALDDSHGFVSLASARDLTGLGTRGLEIRALVDDPARAAAMRQALLREFPASSMEIQTWKEFQGSLMVFVELFDVFMLGINAFLAVVAAMVITNALLMNFLERLPSVATLRAIGMRRAGSLGLALREGVLLGGLGTAAGVVAGAVAVWALSGRGLDLGQAGAALGVGATIPFRLDGVLVAECVLAGLATVLAAALYAGTSGSRTPILEGLKES